MRSLSLYRSCLVICVLGLSQAAPALAADVSSRDTAGAEEARFQRDRLEDNVRPASSEAPSVIKESAPAPVADDGATFRVSDIRITGNHSIPDAQLRPFAATLIGREVSLADIRAAVDGMKKYYRAKGFVAAYVYIPPQQLSDGVLKIDVLEGRLGAVKVTGGRWFSSARLERFFRLKPGEVLRYETLRRYLDRVNDHQDVKAKAVLAPGAETGTTDVKIEIEDKAPYHLSGDINNSGTENTGEYRYGLAASHTNLTGNLDKLESSLQFGKGVDALGAGYSLPVNDTLGTRLGYTFSYATVDVGGSFAPLDVKGTAETHRVYASQPLFEKENFRVSGTLGVDSKNVENKLLGAVSGKDALIVPNADISLKETDGAGATLLSNRFSLGIADFLGSSDRNDRSMSRLGTGGDFFSYRGTAVRVNKISNEVLMVLRGTLQLSPDALAPSEQISLGGARSVRGYQEGEYLGDQGGYASADIYVQAWFIPEEWRLLWAEENLKKQVQLIFFADAGRASLRKPLTGEQKDKDLAGAGGGFRMHLYDKFYGRLEWAVPLGDRPFDGRDKAFYFTVSYDFL